MLVRYHIYSQDLSFHSCLVTLASCNGRPILNAQQYCNFKFALIQSANSKENLHFQCHALSEKSSVIGIRQFFSSSRFRFQCPCPSPIFTNYLVCLLFSQNKTKTNLAKAYRDFVISFRNNLYRLSSRNHG